MRHVNWGSITASGDGDFKRLEPGPYVAKVVTMTDKPEKEYVELVYDIAEGPRAGFYSDDWGLQHPYAHHVFLSYKDKALGMLKGRLEAIQSSNPGFDPFAAWDAGRLDMFAGRVFGINLQEEEYERSDGETGTRLNVCQVVPAQDVRDGKVKQRAKKTLDGKAPKAATPKAGAEDAEPVPFD
jgi:hypothetical protein